jgi:uncharacterized repeat protein (TIGR01451 family)
MAGVVSVGLFAVYQAQKGMLPAALTSTDAQTDTTTEEGPDADALAEPIEQTAEPNPFADEPSQSIGLPQRTAAVKDKATQPTLAAPREESPFEEFEATAETKPAAKTKSSSGPGLDFRNEFPETAEATTQPSTAVQPAAFEEGTVQLPTEVDPAAIEQVNSEEVAEPRRNPLPRRPTAIKPFVRQARDEVAATATTEPDPFAPASPTPSNDPVSNPVTVPDPRKDLEETPANDPFETDRPKPTKPDLGPAQPIETPVAPPSKPASEPDPFGNLESEPPPVTNPNRTIPVDAPTPKKPIATPEDDSLSTPFSPNSDPETIKPRNPKTFEPEPLPEDIQPKRGRMPKLPTEIPAPANDLNPPVDFPDAPPERETTPVRNPLPKSRPENDPADFGSFPERTVPIRRPVDQPPALDNDLIGDGTVGPASPRGVQQPRLTIEKIAPQQATLGEAMVYSILIKNVGNVDAQQVLVEDRIPRGTEMTGSSPKAEIFEKKLQWRLGTLKPGEEKKIAIRVIPRQEGPVGSVARVSFAAEAAAEIVVASPQLSFNVKAPRQVRMGETFDLTFYVKNIGSAAANNVSVRDMVPSGLKHEAAADIECPIGKLGANETREVVLTVTAVKPGRTTNRAILSGDGGISQELETPIEVIGEQLVLTRSGQTKVYVDRPTQFTNSIRNDGNAEVANVRVAEIVPAGMEFVEASNGGRFDSVQRAIFWDLGALPAGAEASVSSKLVGRTPGALQGKITATGPAGSSAVVKSDVDVIGRPELQIETVGRTGVVAVGDKLTSRIQLKNHGSASARNVGLSIRLPRELKLIEIRGAEYSFRDSVVSFQPVASIGPNETVGFELVMEAVAEAEAQMNLEIQADHLNKPARRSETVQIATEIR